MSELQLGATVRECMRVWLVMKADGASLEERLEFVSKAIRGAWPFTREWRYECPRCDDFGLEMRTCGGQENAPCGHRKPHRAHDYGRPCTCRHGAKFEKRERSQDDVVAAAARTQRNSGFTRAGR